MKRTGMVYVVAEIGINHNGSTETAQWLIDAAVQAGADAVKFQKRTISLVYTPEELAKPRQSPWGTTTREQKEGLEFSEDQYRLLAGYCQRQGIAWSASCWDEESVRFVAGMGVPWLKVPSALITDHALLGVYAATGLPLILSTGMSTVAEINGAVASLQGCDLTLLHCTSTYPCDVKEINLKCIQWLKQYGCPVGFSSHSKSPWPILGAVALGAQVVEAHITLDHTMYGSDQAASLEPQAFAKIVQEVRDLEVALGNGKKVVYPSEEPIKAKLRRSYVA